MRRITLPKKNVQVLRVQQFNQDGSSMNMVKRPLKSAHLEIQFNDDAKFEAWARNVAKQYLMILRERNGLTNDKP